MRSFCLLLFTFYAVFSQAFKDVNVSELFPIISSSLIMPGLLDFFFRFISMSMK